MPPPEPQYRAVESGQSRVAMSNSEQRRKPMDGRDKSMGREEYNKALRALQVELCALQDWVKKTGLRVVVVFEGRDAAGKGGIIKVITERVSPRVFRVVALPAPSDRDKSQLYMQRYLRHFPAAGEIAIFDRSWYNRAGVEYVMGFCTKAQHQHFLKVCPEFEMYVVDDGILLIKFWLEVSDEQQKQRFEARITDPLRHWKLSPTDLYSRSKWFAYSRARDTMFAATDTKFAPWYIVPSDDKRRARLNCINHLLSAIPYPKLKRKKVKLPKRSTKGAYDDQATLKGRHFVEMKY
jgi:polyphosphate kinase 2